MATDEASEQKIYALQTALEQSRAKARKMQAQRDKLLVVLNSCAGEIRGMFLNMGDDEIKSGFGGFARVLKRAELIIKFIQEDKNARR